MRIIFAILFLSSLVLQTRAQLNVDSLTHQALSAEHDSARIKSIIRLTNYYKWVKPDSSVYFAFQGIPLAKRLKSEKDEQQLYFYMGEALAKRGDFAFALETQLKGLRLAEKIGEPVRIILSLIGTGSVYFYSHDYENALSYYKKTKDFPEQYTNREKFYSGFIGESYYHLGQIDSATAYIGRAYQLSLKDPNWTVPYYYMGLIHATRKQYAMALEFLRTGIRISRVSLDIIEGYNDFAEVFRQMGNNDSAIFYATNALAMAQALSFADEAIESSSILKDVYKSKGIPDSAFKYEEVKLAAKDSLYSQQKIRQMQSLAFNEQLNQQEKDAQHRAYNNKLKIYGLIAVIAIFLLLAIFLWRNNRYKQKAFNLLQRQKAATEAEKEKTEKTLHELRATQAQLVHAEKMASLGELTAGIAHEIQNPLNFVNNFSELNKELIGEMKQEIASGNYEGAATIAKDVEDNEEKINHHGKRADAIVKAMLQHSRTSSGQKELTDINALCDEYLRLSYHGLRAKDKNFNAKYETDFDNSIGKINIVPQDIGRVLLNLINNGFYAACQAPISGPDSNKIPTVWVSTRNEGNKVLISVRDNGPGIPGNILDKIFQPFFTTKPTGEGTGLGLSLSYDIVTKGHGGELNVKTKEGEGTTFTIQLPINKPA